jgi:hypothetical protein
MCATSCEGVACCGLALHSKRSASLYVTVLAEIEETVTEVQCFKQRKDKPINTRATE